MKGSLIRFIFEGHDIKNTAVFCGVFISCFDALFLTLTVSRGNTLGEKIPTYWFDFADFEVLRIF